MKNLKVLVTGGAGFIGGNFIHYLIENYPNYVIYNLDKLTYAGELTKHSTIKSNSNYQFIKGDITDTSLINKIIKNEKIDIIIHFAAESHVDRSILNPNQFIHTNIVGTQVLLEAALKNNITKFVHISTDEVYGELDFNTSVLFTEDSPLAPNSPYSASKAAADLIVRSYHKTYGLPINITRCSNNYGPYQYPEKLIPLIIEKILNKEKISIYGDGKNIRDWLHVYDHCSAIDLILHKGINGEVYNIGGNNEKTNLEVSQIILQYFNASDKLIDFVPDRLGHDKRYAINPTKIMRLGWIPKYSFEIGIKQTIQWYINNQEWFRLTPYRSI